MRSEAPKGPSSIPAAPPRRPGGPTCARVPAAMRAMLAAMCALAAALDVPAAPAVAATKTTRPLPPFTSLELGRDGCMPVGMRVVEGPAYSLEIVAEVRRTAAPHARAVVEALTLTAADAARPGAGWHRGARGNQGISLGRAERVRGGVVPHRSARRRHTVATCRGACRAVPRRRGAGAGHGAHRSQR